jgi:hypothetical protein
MGWLGFRISIMGRMIERFGTEPIAKMTGLLKDWEGSLETLALALGMQEAGLGETGLSAEQLRATMTKLIDVGPALQTAWLGLEATWIRLAVDNAPALISILASLQSMLEGTGGVIIIYIVSTVAAATAGFAAFVNVLGPVAPIIGVIVGVLVAMSPALIAIGMALFMLQPLIALNTLLHGAWATTLMTVTIPAMLAWISTMWAANAPLWALSTPLLVWVVAIAAVVAALAILYFKWNDIVAFLQNTLGPVLNWIGEKIKWFSDLIGSALSWLTGFFGGAAEATDDFRKSQENLNATIEDVYGSSIGRDIAKSLGEAIAAYKELQDAAVVADLSLRTPIVTFDRTLSLKPMVAAGAAGAAGTVAGAGGETTQNITVYSNPYIANVSGVADIDEVYKASDKGVTDALDKRSYPGGVVP